MNPLDLRDFWTPWELLGSFHALDYLDWAYLQLYGRGAANG